ncbi:MAG: DRTGG domain-containing protein [Lachnospiraceae bacterium]|nr:DRTGG domain-containing protein [Lachnospiraceae bacterium]
MKLEHIIHLEHCKLVCAGDKNRTISKVFCCDLLSIAMAKAPANGAWVTVMGNRNTLAVATLADVACIVLAEGAAFDEDTIKQAQKEGIAVLETELPVFDVALKIHEMI